MLQHQGCQPCKKVCSIFRAEKNSILMKKTVFSPIVQYTCVVINLEKEQYFPKSCSIFEVFSSQNSTKYSKKVPLGISATLSSSVSFHTVTNLNFSGFYFWSIFWQAYVRIYQLAKFRVLILINLWIIADSNSVINRPIELLEKLRSVLNPAPRACAQGAVSQLFS